MVNCDEEMRFLWEARHRISAHPPELLDKYQTFRIMVYKFLYNNNFLPVDRNGDAEIDEHGLPLVWKNEANPISIQYGTYEYETAYNVTLKECALPTISIALVHESFAISMTDANTDNTRTCTFDGCEIPQIFVVNGRIPNEAWVKTGRFFGKLDKVFRPFWEQVKIYGKAEHCLEPQSRCNGTECALLAENFKGSHMPHKSFDQQNESTPVNLLLENGTCNGVNS